MHLNESPISKELLEQVSEQVHISWMKKRMQEGWTYSKERNDIKKTTPCIVPYDELPEFEKEYDRETVRTVVNALLELGYSISKDK